MVLSGTVFINTDTTPENVMLNECWSTHVQRGYKMKGGKQVPNCVPRGIKDSYEPEGEVMSEKEKAADAAADARDRAERAMRRRQRQGSNYDPSEDDLNDSYNPTAEFAGRVMREAFDKMTPGERKDYDSKALKPGSIRMSTPEERERYAKLFQQSRGRAGHKVKKLRDLRKP
jgi:hypothetical protein